MKKIASNTILTGTIKISLLKVGVASDFKPCVIRVDLKIGNGTILKQNHRQI
jgi:hypothetical protein